MTLRLLQQGVGSQQAARPVSVTLRTCGMISSSMGVLRQLMHEVQWRWLLLQQAVEAGHAKRTMAITCAGYTCVTSMSYMC
jgi:hypothetical protein